MYNIYNEYGIVQGDPKQTVIFEINSTLLQVDSYFKVIQVSQKNQSKFEIFSRISVLQQKISNNDFIDTKNPRSGS